MMNNEGCEAISDPFPASTDVDCSISINMSEVCSSDLKYMRLSNTWYFFCVVP